MNRAPDGIGPRPYPSVSLSSAGPIVAAAVLAGGVLMLLHLGAKGLWLDEALSVARARADLGPLWQEIVGSQANMGLYYLLLHFWVTLGTSEFVVRSLSVLFALATIPVVYLLASRLFDRRAGAVAALLLAFNSFFVRYGQEARGYSLAVLLVSVSSYFFVKALQRSERRTWAACTIFSILAVYAHLFSGLVLVAQFASLAFLRRNAVPWRDAIVSGASIGAALAPLAYFVLFRDAGQIDWVPVPRAVDLYHLLNAFSGDGPGLLVAYGLAVALAVWGLIRHRDDGSGDRWPAAFLCAWLVMPIAIAFGVSFAKPIFQPRFLIVALPALVILAAAGLSRIRHQVMFAGATAVVLVLSSIGVRNWYVTPERQYWRRATSDVLSDARPGDAIVFYVYYGRIPFEYYADRLALRRDDVAMLELASGPWIAGNLQPEPSQAVLDALPARHPRVWLVRLQDGSPPGHPLKRHEQSQQIQNALARHYTAARNATYPGGIRVQLYEKRDSP